MRYSALGEEKGQNHVGERSYVIRCGMGKPIRINRQFCIENEEI
jgi:hypothetical protein